ncbi:3-oxo-tetronate kinase [Oricola indica]|jgi:uncharacterized protein YgbK (DUF1537 family)|uniref:3-oxo-tetronate kinase n=1 Tax=Oricola indica TaxID=2872591 RepID=UPI001CBBA751|nr:3-oxo-tetronate kinase [Oricola indica]
MILGAIGDDFTGSSDLGLTLARGGMRTVQYVGVPNEKAAPAVEAGIVALKTRSVPREEAVEQSLAAYAWLKEQGCRLFFFKYCSTFDSTPQGNIGPVIEALVDAIATSNPVLVCPAFPATGRTIYQGHLFVGDRLLSESGMENHPLTPMTDPDLKRWLARQTTLGIGHLPRQDDPDEARAEMLRLTAGGMQLVVADAIEDRDLLTLAEAGSGFDLLTGGSGLALGLPAVLGCTGDADIWKGVRGRAIVFSGSCSRATREQIDTHIVAGEPAMKIEVGKLLSDADTVTSVLDWADRQMGLPLIYSSASPEEVEDAQKRYGRERSADVLEAFFGKLAAAAVERGYRRIVSAGGETSGAVVKALGMSALKIGPEISPGVPALRVAGRDLALALKSGNFGSRDFFSRAANILEGTGG